MHTQSKNDEMSSIEKGIHAQMECEYEERLSSDSIIECCNQHRTWV
jgi:hypothetical protein